MNINNNVTFSQTVKDELLSLELDEKYYDIVLIAIFKCLGNISIDHNNTILTIKTPQLKLVKLLVKILKQQYPNIKYDVIMSNKRNFKTIRKLYTIILYNDIKPLLTKLHLLKNVNDNCFFLEPIDISKYDAKAQHLFVRICFCCVGSVNCPKKEKQYHLEIVVNDNNLQKCIQNIVQQYNINFKITNRKYGSSLYLNKSEEIGDLLNLMGCQQTLFQYEDERILRDIYLTNNRINNADFANTYKIIDSSNKQIEAIEKLKKTKKLETLGIKTQKIAQLRVDHPNVSLNDLVALSHQEFSKSTLNYHLKNIIKLAELND